MTDLVEMLGTETRRIDRTLQTIEENIEGLTEEQRVSIGETRWWGVVEIVAKLRAMERGEGQAHFGLGTQGCTPVADAYDRVVQPGGHPLEAILATFKAWWK